MLDPTCLELDRFTIYNAFERMKFGPVQIEALFGLTFLVLIILDLGPGFGSD